MCEIFVSSWPGFPKMFRRLLKISNDFPKTSEHYRTLPKKSEDVATISEYFWSYLKLFRWLLHVLKCDILARSDTVRTQTQHQAGLLEYFPGELNWIFGVNALNNKLSGFMSQAWQILLSSMHEIDVFAPQAWETRIIREGWQVYGAKSPTLSPGNLHHAKSQHFLPLGTGFYRHRTTTTGFGLHSTCLIKCQTSHAVW